MEEIGNGHQEMQEKIARRTKVAMNLTKGKGIIEGPSLQEEPTSWKGGIDQFIVPNLNNHGEQEKLGKNPSERSNHVDMQ